MPGRVVAGIRLHRAFERRQVVVVEPARGQGRFGARLNDAGVHQADQFFHDEQDVAAGGFAGLRLRGRFAQTRLAIQPRGGELPQAPAKSVLRIFAGGFGTRTAADGSGICAVAREPRAAVRDRVH